MACAAPEEPWDASTHYEVADSAALAPSTGDKVGAGRDAPRRKTKRRKAPVEYTQDNDQGEDAMSPALGGSYMDTGEQTLSPAVGGSCVLVRKACFPDQQTLENLRKLLGDANMLARTPDGVHVDLTSEQIRPAFSDECCLVRMGRLGLKICHGGCSRCHFLWKHIAECLRIRASAKVALLRAGAGDVGLLTEASVTSRLLPTSDNEMTRASLARMGPLFGQLNMNIAADATLFTAGILALFALILTAPSMAWCTAFYVGASTGSLVSRAIRSCSERNSDTFEPTFILFVAAGLQELIQHHKEGGLEAKVCSCVSVCFVHPFCDSQSRIWAAQTDIDPLHPHSCRCAQHTKT
jgi:hypothetical protein